MLRTEFRVLRLPTCPRSPIDACGSGGSPVAGRTQRTSKLDQNTDERIFGIACSTFGLTEMLEFTVIWVERNLGRPTFLS